MRVTLAIDQPGWAFGNIAGQITRHLGDRHEFETVNYWDILRGKPCGCDALLMFWWSAFPQVAEKVKAERKYFGVYDHYHWRTQPAEFCEAAEIADGIWVANETLAGEIKTLTGADAFVLPDGVDHELFPRLPLPEAFTLGWAGNTRAHPEGLKGLSLIREACERLDVPLIVWDRANQPQWGQKMAVKQSEMAEAFYSKISAYICASECEGTPNPALEAMACGRPLLSTRVGIVPTILVDGANGFYIERDVDDIAEKIERLRGLNEAIKTDAPRGWLRSKERFAQMSEWAYRASLRHSWADGARAFEQMIGG